MKSVDTRLAEKLRVRLDAGTLPTTRPRFIWAWPGAGETCSACDQPIAAGQGMYEVDWNEKAYGFHPACYGLWRDELIRRGWYKSS